MYRICPKRVRLKDADSTEFDVETPYPVIFKLRDLVDVEELGGTMRLGAWPCDLARGSLARERSTAARTKSANAIVIVMNSILSFGKSSETPDLVFSGVSPDGKFVEIVELPRRVHPWFIGCQFHPEYKSKPLDAHPLFAAFIEAAHENRITERNFDGQRRRSGYLIHERVNCNQRGLSSDYLGNLCGPVVR